MDVGLDEAKLSGRSQKIADRLLWVQAQWADWLNVRALQLGPFGVKLVLAVLGMGFGGYCLWLVLSGFS